MSNANALELEMLALVNLERAEAGLNELRLNTALNAAAEDHSQWMLEADTFSHTGQNGSSAGDRMADASYPFEGSWQWAENIGWQSERGEAGFSDDVAMIHASLMNSPGHRANILDPDLEEIGIGVEVGEFTTGGNDWEAVMVTQNFATTAADTSALADPGNGSEEFPPADDVPTDGPGPVAEAPLEEEDGPKTTPEPEAPEITDVPEPDPEQEPVEEPVLDIEEEEPPLVAQEAEQQPCEEYILLCDDEFEFERSEPQETPFVLDWGPFFANLWKALNLEGTMPEVESEVAQTEDMPVYRDWFFDCA